MSSTNPEDPTEIIYMQPIGAALDRTLCDLGFGVNPGALRRAILPEVLRLNAKSDAELLLIGIRRCEIPAFVLRHRFPHMDPRAA